MPELPEVETIKRGLAKYLPGQQVSVVELINRTSLKAPDEDIDLFLIGATIIRLRRRAKVLIVELSSGYSLLIHLKMTGQLIYLNGQLRTGGGHPTNSLIDKLPDGSTRAIIKFKSGARLFFNDQRKFGWLKLVPTTALADFFSRHGPEPLRADFNWLVLKNRLKRRQLSSIKAALLDQSVIAGIGNIYADEALFGAKIHPATKVEFLSPGKIKSLTNELQTILKVAIKSGGSSDRNYLKADGQKGSYLKFARVYHRQGQPCLGCGQTIIKIRVAGRGTHLCPYEQRLPARQTVKIKS